MEAVAIEAIDSGPQSTLIDTMPVSMTHQYVPICLREDFTVMYGCALVCRDVAAGMIDTGNGRHGQSDGTH